MSEVLLRSWRPLCVLAPLVYFEWTTRQSGQLVFSRTSETVTGVTGEAHAYKNTHQHMGCMRRCCNAGHKVQICLWRWVKMSVQHVSSIQLTHRESAVFEGHLICEDEAAAKPFINKKFWKWNYTLKMFLKNITGHCARLWIGIIVVKIVTQSLDLGLKLHFLRLKNIDGVTLISSRDFHPAALHKHLRQQLGSGDVCAFSDTCPLAQQLKNRRSLPSVAWDDKSSH